MILLIQMVMAALGISLDTFAAALALGTRTQRGDRERAAVTFALVGGAAPVVGLMIGRLASGWLGAAAGWISALILVALGVWLLVQAQDTSPGEVPSSQPVASSLRAELGPLPNEGRGVRFRPPIFGLTLMAAGLSIDNLLVGLGLGLHGGSSLVLGILVGLSIYGATHLGLHLGARGRVRFGRWALAAAGILLMAVAGVVVAGEF